MVLPGVTLGDKVLVRPFTTVDKDVPSRSIVDSSGIKIGVLTEDRISRLAKKQIYQQGRQ